MCAAAFQKPCERLNCYFAPLPNRAPTLDTRI
jgi:hypothetical protein